MYIIIWCSLELEDVQVLEDQLIVHVHENGAITIFTSSLLLVKPWTHFLPETLDFQSNVIFRKGECVIWCLYLWIWLESSENAPMCFPPWSMNIGKQCWTNWPLPHWTFFPEAPFSPLTVVNFSISVGSWWFQDEVSPKFCELRQQLVMEHILRSHPF